MCDKDHLRRGAYRVKINPFGPLNNNPYRKQMEKQESIQDIKQKRDKLEISQEAKVMQQASRIDEARQEKVKALKAKVEAGEYKVDPQAVANKFYEFWNK